MPPCPHSSAFPHVRTISAGGGGAIASGKTGLPTTLWCEAIAMEDVTFWLGDGGGCGADGCGVMWGGPCALPVRGDAHASCPIDRDVTRSQGRCWSWRLSCPSRLLRRWRFWFAARCRGPVARVVLWAFPV